MKTKPSRILSYLLCASSSGGWILTPETRAVEGALGRPISGTTIMPYAGVVPPAPGLSITIGETYYAGDISGSTTIPVARNLTLGIDLQASFTPIIPTYIWNTSTNLSWNFASAMSLPICWEKAEANVTVGSAIGQRTQEAFGLFDLAFVPIVASHHFSQTEHLALSLTVWAPTGEYNQDDLANLGMNTWTFIPGMAYTKVFPNANVELSASWNLTFDTKNPATDYQNGILSDLEAVAVKRFKCGAGLGVVGSWIEQLTDDRGTTADALNGFQGRAFGVGPLVTYSTHLEKRELEFNARWIHEFENKNYVKGNVLMLNAILKF